MISLWLVVIFVHIVIEEGVLVGIVRGVTLEEESFFALGGSNPAYQLQRRASVLRAIGQLGAKSEATVNKGLLTLAQLGPPPDGPEPSRKRTLPLVDAVKKLL